MYTLILPVAGSSSRFPGMRPKWLLTMPDGKLMIEKAVEKIDLNIFSSIVIVCLSEHLAKFTSAESVVSSFKATTGITPRLVVLDEPTLSQSETIYRCLVDGNIEGPFFIKDCDNLFSLAPSAENCIASVNLNDMALVDAKNKSYIDLDGLGHVVNIVEKKVISDEFCCGGYGFESSVAFQKAFEAIDTKSSEIYISHIIYHMLLAGIEFKQVRADHYVDWGTLREYRHYCRSHLTVFCDVDGVLLQNGSKFSDNGWQTEGIKSNLKKISQLQSKGSLYLVLTSCRPQENESYVESVLAQHDVRVDRFVFGLPHTRRLLVNDFSATNPYPSAIAFNLERDSESLDKYFDHLALDI